jgi:hypothetical protein
VVILVYYEVSIVTWTSGVFQVGFNEDIVEVLIKHFIDDLPVQTSQHCSSSYRGNRPVHARSAIGEAQAQWIRVQAGQAKRAQARRGDEIGRGRVGLATIDNKWVPPISVFFRKNPHQRMQSPTSTIIQRLPRPSSPLWPSTTARCTSQRP